MRRKEHNVMLSVLVPSNCTDQLQPIDLSVNKPPKDHIQNKFTTWYADMNDQLEHGVQVEEVKVDLRLSIMKEVEAKWHLYMTTLNPIYRTIIINGLKKAGIL